MSDTPTPRTDIEARLTALLNSFAGNYDIRLLAGDARDEIRAIRAELEQEKKANDMIAKERDAFQFALEQKGITIAAKQHLLEQERKAREIAEGRASHEADLHAHWLGKCAAAEEKYRLLSAQHGRLCDEMYEADGETLRHVAAEARCERLKDELSRACRQHESAAEKWQAAAAREAALREDAERYRWLRDASVANGELDEAGDTWQSLGDALGKDFDRLIDAASAGKEPDRAE